eukprot:TRINITY_DN13339_c0_g1_i2.p1 TRINITY_DN13339_c0_g1~~TRINITY_DN13339_c0_g1_i2.p1  ORF type:complete len:556 (+),score=108.70 TRINITY_DN13339_c0_g1_i2:36-1703(+)
MASDGLLPPAAETEPHSEEKKWYENGLWQPPKLMRGPKGDSFKLADIELVAEREMSWSELFYDLIFVTAVAKVGEELKGGHFTVGVYILYILTVFGFWASSTNYGTRFHADDISSKGYFSLQMMGMVGISMNIPGSYGEDTSSLAALASSAAFIRGFEFLMHVRIARHFHVNPTATVAEVGFNRVVRYGFENALGALVQAILWLALAIGWISMSHSLWVFGADLFWRNFKSLLAFSRFFAPAWFVSMTVCTFNNALPFHLPHYTERLGLIMIIMLGESVDGICVQMQDGSNSSKLYGTVFAAYLVVYSMKLLYFDVVVVDEDNHVMRKSPRWFVGWDFLHQFLAVALTTTGDALAILSKKTAGFELEENCPDGRKLLCWAVCSAHLLLMYIGHVHFDPNQQGDTNRASRFRLAERLQLGIQAAFAGMAGGLTQVSENSLSDLGLVMVLALSCFLTAALNLADEVLEISWPLDSGEHKAEEGRFTEEQQTCGLAVEHELEQMRFAIEELSSHRGKATLLDLKQVLDTHQRARHLHGFHAPHVATHAERSRVNHSNC